MIPFFAQGPNVPWDDTTKWLFGAMGLLGVVWLIFAVIIQIKKLFGRTPPMNEELDARDKRLRAMIYAAERNLKEEQARQLRLIVHLQEQHEELQADRIRKWEELTNKIGEVANKVAYIAGTLKKNES